MDRRSKWKEIDAEEIVVSLPKIVIDLGYATYMNDKVILVSVIQRLMLRMN